MLYICMYIYTYLYICFRKSPSGTSQTKIPISTISLHHVTYLFSYLIQCLILGIHPRINTAPSNGTRTIHYWWWQRWWCRRNWLQMFWLYFLSSWNWRFNLRQMTTMMTLQFKIVVVFLTKLQGGTTNIHRNRHAHIHDHNVHF